MSFDSGITRKKYFHFNKFEDFELVSNLIGLSYSHEDGYYYTDTRSCIDQVEFDTLVDDLFNEVDKKDMVFLNQIFEELQNDISKFDSIELSYSA